MSAGGAEGAPGAAAGLEVAAAVGVDMELHGGLETEAGGSVATEVAPPGLTEEKAWAWSVGKQNSEQRR